MTLKFSNTTELAAVKSYLGKCNDGRTYVVTVKRAAAVRSNSQNRLYWLYVACIADETGNDRETVHNELRRRLLPRLFGKFAGKEVERLQSTSQLNSAQFTQYIDRVVAFAHTELGIALPNPADAWWEQFQAQYEKYI